jgi:hypothetical protein
MSQLNGKTLQVLKISLVNTASVFIFWSLTFICCALNHQPFDAVSFSLVKMQMA